MWTVSASGIEKHLSAYAVWFILGVRVFPDKLWRVFYGGILFGSAIEILQWPLAWRTFNMVDVAGNVAGLLLGVIFIASLKMAGFWQSGRYIK